jgi:hypothetical protein
MQFKSITAIIVLLLVVVSLLEAGCTTTTTVTNQTTSPPTTSADLTDKLNNAFTSQNNAVMGQNFTVITPFTRTVNQYGNVVYSGVVKDGGDKLVPYVYNLTLEETKNRNESITRFNASVAQALTMGYSQTYNQTQSAPLTGLLYSWYGQFGDGLNPANKVRIRIGEPTNHIGWADVYTSLYDLNHTVVSEYATKV